MYILQIQEPSARVLVTVPGSRLTPPYRKYSVNNRQDRKKSTGTNFRRRVRFMCGDIQGCLLRVPAPLRGPYARATSLCTRPRLPPSAVRSPLRGMPVSPALSLVGVLLPLYRLTVQNSQPHTIAPSMPICDAKVATSYDKCFQYFYSRSFAVD